MFSQQQLPADRSAKAPANNSYLTAVYTSFKKVADSNGLLLYTDWASPSMYTTLQNQYQELLAGRTSAEGMAKAVQSDWEKFDKTLH
jgi:raffinose/stachyose/melibiose transport system substrate-binding protein